MRLIIVSGPPSSGKTSVILKTIAALKSRGQRVGVCKFDCLHTEDEKRYQAAGIAAVRGLSGGLCPDHFFAANIEEVMQWGIGQQLDILITESAGLCNRCSPFLKEALGICVVDNLSGLGTPKKIGPMLQLADFILITKGDIVSQAEREVFAAGVAAVNPKACVMHIGGLSGQGADELAGFLLSEAKPLQTAEGCTLRFPMPSALCSYCLGETRIGAQYQLGNVRKIDWEGQRQ